MSTMFHRIKGFALIVAVLAVGAIAAPAASASSGWVVGPNLDPQAAEPAAAPAARGYLATRVVRSNPDEQLPQAATSSRDGLAEPRLRAAFAQALQTHGRSDAATSTSSLSATGASTPSGSQGFQFDDAAIGVGVIAGLTLIGMAGVLTVRRRDQLQRP